MPQWGELHRSVKWKWKCGVLGNSLYVIYKYIYIKSIYLAVPDLCCGMQTLSCALWDPWLGTEPRPPALGVWSHSHWTTRKAPLGDSRVYLLALLEDHRTNTDWLSDPERKVWLLCSAWWRHRVQNDARWGREPSRVDQGRSNSCILSVQAGPSRRFIMKY